MNNYQPLVSINITTHNRAHYLPRAIDSVLSQSYDNIEIVIVDDCSTDKTPDVISDYQKKDSRIRTHRHRENQGNAKARNTALSLASGVYIAFMDDDDIWISQEKLSNQINHLNAHPHISLVCTGVRRYSASTVYHDKVPSQPRNLEDSLLRGNGLIYNSTVVARRDLFETVGCFDEHLQKGIDSEFFRRCVVWHRQPIAFLPDITTAIYEYGSDRMTPVQTREQTKKALGAHWHVTKKYYRSYLRNPTALAVRLRNMSKLAVKYISR